MSRAAKKHQQQLFSKLPQKPASPEFQRELENEHFSPKCVIRRETSIRETFSCSGLLYPPPMSKVKEGVALKVSEIFQALNPTESEPGLTLEVKMRRSAPMVSMTMLNNSKNNKNDKQKIFKKNSSQTSINNLKVKDVKASKRTSLCAAAYQKGRMLWSLVSQTPEYEDPREILKRFFTMTEIQDPIYIVTLIYLQRALDSETELGVRHFHKLLAGCLLLAHKYLIEGQFWDFEDFSFLSGVSARHLGNVEKCILMSVLRYDLFVSEEEYEGILMTLTTSEAF